MIAREKGLQPFRVNAVNNDINLPVEKRIAPPVEQWLRGFYDAEFVVTDSFHACVFSILFNKPFIAIGNPARGMSRFTSLLGMFGLEDRMVTATSEFRKHIETDWERAFSFLNGKRKEANNFLSNILSKQ